jgi:hypothetical protein
MSKIYEYKGKTYYEGMEIGNSSCEGDLYDLYLCLKDEGKVDEETIYYFDCECYSSPEELIKDNLEELGIEVGEQE